MNVRINWKRAFTLVFCLVLLAGMTLMGSARELPPEVQDKMASYLIDQFNITEEVTSESDGKSSINGVELIPVEGLTINAGSLEGGLAVGVALFGEDQSPYLMYAVSLTDEYDQDYALGLFNQQGQVKYVSELSLENVDELAETPIFYLREAEGEGDLYRFELHAGQRKLTGVVPSGVN